MIYFLWHRLVTPYFYAFHLIIMQSFVIHFAAKVTMKKESTLDKAFILRHYKMFSSTGFLLLFKYCSYCQQCILFLVSGSLY